MFADNYSTAPWNLIEQRAEAEELLKRKEEGVHEIAELPPAERGSPDARG